MNFKVLASALVLMGTAASAQTAEDLRIYINPGHGSWTGNDRPIQVIGHEYYSSTNTDTLGFFESNTDLIKGFGVLEKLIEMGVPFDRTLNQTGERWQIGAARDLEQNLVMSRVKNGPYESNNTTSSDNYMLYNRNLTEICYEVEENDFDMFISIHSNAAGSGGTTPHNSVNYHLFMYRGYNGREGEAVEGSYDICETTSKFSFANAHAQWSEDHTYINGETDFMGHGKGSYNSLGYYGYLGVLKHGTPGYLVEGFFHTYTPSTHRAMNFDVDLIEGYLYARGVGEWFELEKRDETGEIYGIVRDAHQSFTSAMPQWIARAGSDDVLKPINNCKVYLWKDGQKIKEYTTDNYYNGAFVFIGLEPGTYQVTFESPDYLEADPIDVEVVAGDTSYPKIYLTDAGYYGRPGEEMNYENPVPESMGLEASYDLVPAYVDQVIPQFDGYTPKRMIWNKGHLYILGHYMNEGKAIASILVIDPHTGELLRKINPVVAEGMEAANGYIDFSDIQVTGSGVLLACSSGKNQYDDRRVEKGEVRGEIIFYRWENDEAGLPTGDPIRWIVTQSSGGWYRAYVGESFVFRGNLEEGELLFSAVNSATNVMLRTASAEVVDGEIVKSDSPLGDFYINSISGISRKDFNNDDYQLVLSPINRHQFYVIGDAVANGIRDYDFNHETAPAYNNSQKTVGYDTRSAGFFKFGKDIAMTMCAADGLKFYNITRGLSTIVPIEISGADFTGTADRTLTTGYPVVYKDGDENVTGADFNIMVLRDNKLSRFATSEKAGVESVKVETETDAPVVYYDINGRRVQGNLTPGLYIRVQGTHASKIYVK